MKHLPRFVLFTMLSLIIGLFSCGSPNSTESSTDTPTPTQIPSPTPIPDSVWSFFHNDVSSDTRRLAFDQGGYLWAIGYGGVMRWNLEEETYVTYTETDGLSNERLRSILVDKYNVPWVANDNEIFSFDGESWVSYPYPSSGWTKSFSEGANNDLWLCTTDGLFQFDGTEWIIHGIHNGMPDDYCFDLAIDPDGNLWVISAVDILSHYTGQWENIDAPTNLVESDENVIDLLSKIYISPTGELWVTSYFHVSNVNMVQNTWNLYSIPEREGAISAFAISSSGTPWMAHKYKGKTRFRVFNGETWPIIMPSGYEKGLNYTFNGAITDPDGAIWFFGEDLFIRTMQTGWTVFNDAHAAWNPSQNQGVAFSADGTLYFATKEGILALGESKEDLTIYQKQEEEKERLKSNEIIDLQIDADGNVYTLQKKDGVIQVYNGSSWKTIHESEFYLNKRIVVQDSTLWIIQKNSLKKYDGLRINEIDESIGLFSDVVWDVIEDDQNAIWVTHGSKKEGISMWDGVRWNVFPTSGPGNDFLEGGLYDAYLSPQGILWFEVDKPDLWLVSYHDEIWTIYPPDPRWEEVDDFWILDVQFNQHDQPIVLVVEKDPDNSYKTPVYEYDGYAWNQIDLNEELFKNKIFYHQDTLWVGTIEYGVYYRVDSQDGTGEWEHLSDSNWEGGTHVTLIAAGVEGDVWVTTQESINIYRDGEWIFFPQGEDGFIDVTSFAIAPDGSVWFGSDSQGIARFGRP